LASDFHLLLGKTREMVFSMALALGFPKSYDWARMFLDAHETDWITADYGNEMTGYDFAEFLKRWTRKSGNETWSLAEVWIAQKREQAQMAQVFVSHIQSQTLEATMKHVPHDVPVWLDYLILRQCRSDFRPEQIYGVIRFLCKKRGALAILDEPLMYLKRSFCVFEIACADKGKLSIPAIDTNSKVSEAKIDAQAADCRNKKHKGLVDGFIIGKFEDYESFNECVTDSLTSALQCPVVDIKRGHAEKEFIELTGK